MRNWILAIALLFASTCCAYARQFVYTVQVDTLDPRETPITVELTWPDGTETNVLAERRMVCTSRREITREFSLMVRISKAHHFTWRKMYVGGDFIPAEGNSSEILERVRLQVLPGVGTREQLEVLSQALPVGLNAYSRVLLADENRDGQIDHARLSRRTSDSDSPYHGLRRSPSQSPWAELRAMRLVATGWHCEFLADHRGVWVNGELVPDTLPAPFGFRTSYMGGDGGVLYHDLYAIDEDGQRRPNQLVRSYIWRRMTNDVAVVVFDPKETETLKGLLSDSSVLIMQKSAYMLANLREQSAVGPMIDALSRSNPHARLALAEALRRLTKKNFGEDQAAWRKWHEESQQPPERDK